MKMVSIKERRKRFTERALYKNIKELPTENYYNLLETGDLTLLLKQNIKNIDVEVLENKLEEINDEIIDSFGFSKEQKQIIYKEQQILWLTYQDQINPNSIYKTKLEIVKKDFEELVSDGDKVDFYEIVAILEQYRGIALDLKKTSLYMFLTYKKMYEFNVKYSIL